MSEMEVLEKIGEEIEKIFGEYQIFREEFEKAEKDEDFWRRIDSIAELREWELI